MKEVREGYKMTELGEIPREWKVSGTEEIVTTTKNAIKIGPFGSQLKKEFLVESGYKVYGQENVFSKNYSIGSRYVTEKKYKELSSCKLEPGDFVISMMGTVGKCDVIPEEIEKGIMDSHLLRMKIDTNIMNTKLLTQLIGNSNIIKKQLKKLSVGGIMEGLSSTIVKQLKFPVPPLPEQQKIADILSTVDEQIDNVDQLIEKTKELKKGLMQQLLIKGIGHTEFKETEVGVIPKEWEVKNLGEVIKFQAGYAFKSSEFIDKGLRVIKITNAQQHKLVWDDINFVPYEFEEKYKDFVLKENDIILPMTRPIISSGIKVCRVVKEDLPCVLNQRVGRFVIKQGVLSNYLYQYIFTPYFVNKVEELSSTTGQPNISAKQIEEILIAIPSIKEQKKITQGLEEIDIKVKCYENRKSKLEQLKKGLMQQLLTGKIRVNIEQ